VDAPRRHLRGRGSNQGNTQNEKFPYYQSSIDFRCYLEMALFEPRQIGYQLLSAEQAAGLSRAGNALGMDIGRAQQITDGGMTFDLLRVNGVRRGSSGAQAGFNVADQIIAADSRVFQNVATFAAHVG